MLALFSTWIGLASFLTAVVMLIYRPAMTDVTITCVLYFGSPGAMCLAGLELWANRKEPDEPGLAARRLQCSVAIGLAIAAAAIVYGLVMWTFRGG